jgi:hypothetical protein
LLTKHHHIQAPDTVIPQAPTPVAEGGSSSSSKNKKVTNITKINDSVLENEHKNEPKNEILMDIDGAEVYLYIYMCMCIYTHIRICIRISVLDIHIHIHIQICRILYLYIHIYIYIIIGG